MQTYEIGKNQAGQRLDKFLRKFMPDAGSSFLYKMLRKKNITLNGKKAEGSESLQMGDKIQFFFSDETYLKFTNSSSLQIKKTQEPLGNTNSTSNKTKTNLSSSNDNHYKEYRDAYHKLQGISIVYEDDNIIILNKPAGILTQKASPKDLSLNEWMIGYLLHENPEFFQTADAFKPSVCNRLDRNTSGLVLCGKSLPGTQYLNRIVQDRSIRKFYRTICIGETDEYSEVSGYLYKDVKSNKVNIIQEKFEKQANADYIKTAYRKINKLQNNYTLLEVELITGKTHQIRAHLASLGHPIIGDFKYGNRKINEQLKAKYHLEYQLLHAYRLEFPSDDTSKSYGLDGKIFVAPYPSDFQNIITNMNGDI